MRWFISVMLFAGFAGAQAPDAHLLGFTSDHARAEVSYEKEFRGGISTESLKTFHREFTRTPHPAGTVHDKEVADFIAKTWREQGLEDVTIRQYDVLGSLPREIVVEMTAPVAYKASLREAPYEEDPDTKNPEVRGAW